MSRPGEEIVLSCTGGGNSGGATANGTKEKHQIPSAEMKERSSKSLIANVLDIDDDYRCNHRCNSGSLLQNPTYYRTVNRYTTIRDGEIISGRLDSHLIGWLTGGGPFFNLCSRQVVDDGSYGGQITDVNNCLGSSAEFELALILKELRWITDQVSARFVVLRVPCCG